MNSFECEESFCKLLHSVSHPKVNSNGGYKVASQKCPIFKAHQDACLPHGRVSQQHNLDRTPPGREEEQQVIDSLHMMIAIHPSGEEMTTEHCAEGYFAIEFEKFV